MATSTEVKGEEDVYYQRLYKSYSQDARADDGSHPLSSGRRGRSDVLQWEDYFMALALLVAQRSEDPETKVGAVIVRGMSCTDKKQFHQVKKITGIGYNCMPTGIGDEDRLRLWQKKNIKTDGWLETKYPYVCHAAINAILSKNAEDLTGCTLFTTLLPSNEDAKLIIQAGITEVVYCEDRQKKYNHIAQKMFNKTGIKYTQLETYRRKCTDLRVKECEERAKTHRRAKVLEDGGEGAVMHERLAEDGGEEAVMHEKLAEDGGEGAVMHEKLAEDGGEEAVMHEKLAEDGGEGAVMHEKLAEDGGKGAVMHEKLAEDGGKGAVMHEKLAEECDKAAKEEGDRQHPDFVLYPTSEDCEVKEDTTKAKTLSAEEFYMCIACLSARRSKDPSTQVGACIVNVEGEVVGIGYNGWPYGISDDDPEISWGKKRGEDPVKVKSPYVVHAEANAIMHKTCISLKGCRIYTTLFPCNECAKLIIQSGITEVYYLRKPKQESGKPERLYVQASRRLLSLAGYEGPDLDPQPSSTNMTEDPSNLSAQQPSRGKPPPKKCQKFPLERKIEIRWPEHKGMVSSPKETENGTSSNPAESARKQLQFSES